jgi:UDP-2,3-diacylglucosamine hydrolase
VVHLLLADGHFVGAPGEATGFARLLEKAKAAGVTEISILGDFFELWVGLLSQEAPWQMDFLSPLFRLREAGVRMRYVVGNKDYFIEHWNAHHRLFDEVHTIGCVVPSPLGPLHLAHGDLVNRRDWPYRSWRFFSRSTLSALLMRILPPRMLGKLASLVARRLKRTNRYHKSYFPIEELRARARELEPGPATLIFGHFHRHTDVCDGDKRIITLPFLGGEMAGIVVDAQGIRLISGMS